MSDVRQSVKIGALIIEMDRLTKENERYREALEWLEHCNPDTNDVNQIAHEALTG